MALPNAEIMICQPAIPSEGIKGSVSDIEIISDHLKKTRGKIDQILAGITGKSIDEITANTNREYFMTAQQALVYGLIDEVVDND